MEPGACKSNHSVCCTTSTVQVVLACIRVTNSNIKASSYAAAAVHDDSFVEEAETRQPGAQFTVIA
jgi:hypothetical protein